MNLGLCGWVEDSMAWHVEWLRAHRPTTIETCMVWLFSQFENFLEHVQSGVILKNYKNIQEGYLTDVVLEKCKNKIRVKQWDKMLWNLEDEDLFLQGRYFVQGCWV